MGVFPGSVLSTVAQVGIEVALGYGLRRSGFIQRSDADGALKLAVLVTIPSVAFKVVSEAGLPMELVFALPAVGALHCVAMAAGGWVMGSDMARRERAAYLVCSAGASVSIAGPLSLALLGPFGAACVFVAGIPAALTSTVGAYTLASSAGPAFPEQYVHDDGGVYSGEWQGVSKSGRGVYRYRSGARYEGEWRRNLKDGRGVYYYPKGGMYEGEWSGGLPEGVGVRTYSDGRVEAGRWRRGRLEEPLELWQCAGSAQGASEAAAAARAVRVGGFKAKEALEASLNATPALAAVVAAGLSLAGVETPGAIMAVAEALGNASIPLVMLCLGASWRLSVTARVALAASRALLPRILLGGAVLSAVGVAGALGVLGRADSGIAGAAAAFGVLSVAPMSGDSVGMAERFRLDTETVRAAQAISQAVGLGTMLLVGILCCATSQPAAYAVAVPTMPGGLACWALVAVGASLSFGSVGVFLWLSRMWGVGSRVRMVYQGRQEDRISTADDRVDGLGNRGASASALGRAAIALRGGDGPGKLPSRGFGRRSMGPRGWARQGTMAWRERGAARVHIVRALAFPKSSRINLR